MAAHAAVSFNTITQKPNKFLQIYSQAIVDCIMQLLIKLHEENHFVASINNTDITDKIAKQVWYAPETLQDAF